MWLFSRKVQGEAIPSGYQFKIVNFDYVQDQSAVLWYELSIDFLRIPFKKDFQARAGTFKNVAFLFK
jgi:hypothetical protein